MRVAALVGVLALGAGMFLLRIPAVAADSKAVPAATLDIPPTKGPQTVVLSGGCFWGVQGVFEHVRGVQRAVAGYAGGDKSTAQYEIVSSGMTGHAESVKII